MESKQPRYYLEIFLISFAALILEISYTRIFSFKYYYFFTYMIISQALLGLGAGGLCIAIFSRLRAVALQRLIPVCCLAGGVSIALGYFTIALLEADTLTIFNNAAEVLKLTLVSLCLFSNFFCVGIMIASLFAHNPKRINRLYFADLLGAGAGCAMAIPLISFVSPPGCIFVAAFVLVIAGMPQALKHWKPAAVASAVVAVVLAFGILYPGFSIDPRVDVMKPLSKDHPIAFSEWNPVFRVDVTNTTHQGQIDERRRIAHDGMWGSVMMRVNRDISELKYFDTDVRSLPFTIARRNPRVLIIGAAAGHEILASIYFGAEHTTAVELNSTTYSLLTQHFANYSGRLPERDDVTYLNEEGRSFLARIDDRFDLIYYVAPDSYSAMNAASSGAFVLSESYLYTVEAVEDALNHLAPGGILAMQFGEWKFDQRPNRTARYLATAREAIRRLGVDEFDSRVVIGTTKGFPATTSTILVRMEPFTEQETGALRTKLDSLRHGTMRYPSDDGQGGPLEQIISLPYGSLPEWFESYPYDVSPALDDRPFFWHFARFRELSMQNWGTSYGLEHGFGERLLIVLLIICTTLGAVFLLLPFLVIRRTWSELPYKPESIAYFAALGLGFMFFEVCLIQKLTLFIGYPTYSLTVTLMSILTFAGFGSMLSERYSRYGGRAIVVLFLVLLSTTLLFLFAATPLVKSLIHLPLGLRIALSVLFVAPLGLSLGGFLPIGLSTFAESTEHKEEYIAWGWAVNGFFSVIGSILATMLSMTFGFNALMVIGLGIYGLGMLTLYRVMLGVRARAAA